MWPVARRDNRPSSWPNVCEQLAHIRYVAANRPEVKPATLWSQIRCPNHGASKPQR